MPDLDLTQLANSDVMHGLESELGLPAGFLFALQNEDDWSFVIKSHALVEAGLTQVVTQELGRPELKSVVARLETSDTESGKLALAKILDVLRPDEQRLVIKLSELRNRLVHDVRETSFAFASYVAGLDTNAEQAMADAFSLHLRVTPGSPDRPDAKAVRNLSIPTFRNSPKAMIWGSLVALLWVLNWRNTLAKIEHAQKSIGAKLLVQLGRQFGKDA